MNRPVEIALSDIPPSATVLRNKTA